MFSLHQCRRPLAQLAFVAAFSALSTSCVEAEIDDLDAAMQKETPPAYCGDGRVNWDEECERGRDIALTCADFDLPTGIVECTSECTFDTRHCLGDDVCGNGVVEPDEACDEPGASRRCSYSELGPCMVCYEDCTLGPGDGPYCGDGVVNGPERCDTDAFRTSCEDLGWEGGEIACVACTPDTSGCTGAFCGDGVVEGAEECDHEGSPEWRCEYGTPSCTVCGSGCVLIEAVGAYCGNGVVDFNTPEVCEPARDRDCGEGWSTATRCADDCLSLETIDCGDDVGGTDAWGADASEDPDAAPADTGPSDDATEPDATAPEDATPPDARPPEDAVAPGPDEDAGLSDAGADDTLADAEAAEPDAPGDRSIEDESGCSAAPGSRRSSLPALAALAIVLGQRRCRRGAA